MGEPAPWEYVEYVLCRHVFHCSLAELRQMPPEDILIVLNILGAEAEVRALQRQLG